MSNDYYQDDLMSSDTNEGKLRLELRKLSNSDGWVSSQLSSPSDSRGSTPFSQKSIIQKSHSKSSKPIPDAGKTSHKSKKKFHMVLEKDDDFEVDYLTPDEGDSSTSSLDRESLSHSLSESELSDHEEILSHGSPVTSWHEDAEMCDEEEIPELKLPKSSEDLLLPNDLVLPALSVYEVLRHFRNTLRLSPFLFEDFCAALMSNETTVLLNECHIMLLKSLLKEEENLGTMFVPLDQKDAYNTSLYFIDYLTWPEVLRAYVQSSSNFSSVLAIVEEDGFPCVEVAKKIKVLQFLSDILLSSTKIRDELMMDGSIRYDDHCRVCHRLGDLLCCETCPAVYHLACCNPPLKEVPEEEWQCEICQIHKLNGVSNCESETEFSTQYLRHEPIGVDRHGRKYWFLARRLFVESPKDTFYYTTFDEFKFVLSKLDHSKYEMVLCEALKDVLDEFPRQSKISEELTDEAKWKEDSKTQIEAQKEQLKKTIEDEKFKPEKKNEGSETPSDETNTSDEKEKPAPSLSEDKSSAVSSCITTTTTTTTSEPRKTDQVNTTTPTSISTFVSTSVSITARVTTSISNSLMIPASTPAAVSAPVPISTPVAVSAPVPISVPVAISTSIPVSTPVPIFTNTPISAPAPLPSLAPIRKDMGRIVLPKANFIPLSIRVPLTRCDAQVPPKQANLLNPMIKVAPKVQLKPAVPQLKSLFVLSKDGVKTPLTIGSDGRLTAGINQRFIMINKPVTPTTTPPLQGRLSRELKRLQFSGAGPKMQKLATLGTPGRVTTPVVENAEPVKTTVAEPPKPVNIPVIPQSPFKLGEDKGYKQYKNHFVENTLAMNKYQHKEEKDKDRHVGYKFSITGPVEFDWSGTLCGKRDEVVHTMRTALFSFEQHVPLCFMHSRWEQYRKMWGRMLVQNDTVKAFAAVLGILEMAIRNNAKKTVWNEGLGQVRLRRITVAEKEQYEKHKKYKSKLKQDLVQRNAVWCKYPLPVQISLLSKLRGEDYRVTGYGGWMWISSTFKCSDQKAESKPFTVYEAEPSGDETGDVIDVSRNLLVRSHVYKKRWGASKVDKLLRWRILQEKERIRKLEKSKSVEESKKDEDSSAKESNPTATKNPNEPQTPSEKVPKPAKKTENDEAIAVDKSSNVITEQKQSGADTPSEKPASSELMDTNEDKTVEQSEMSEDISTNQTSSQPSRDPDITEQNEVESQESNEVTNNVSVSPVSVETEVKLFMENLLQDLESQVGDTSQLEAMDTQEETAQKPLGESHENTLEPEKTLGESHENTPEPEIPLGESHKNTPEPEKPLGESHENTPEPEKPLGESHENTPEPEKPLGESHENTPEPEIPLGESHENTPEPEIPLGESHENTPEPEIPLGESHENTPEPEQMDTSSPAVDVVEEPTTELKEDSSVSTDSKAQENVEKTIDTAFSSQTTADSISINQTSETADTQESQQLNDISLSSTDKTSEHSAQENHDLKASTDETVSVSTESTEKCNSEGAENTEKVQLSTESTPPSEKKTSETSTEQPKSDQPTLSQTLLALAQDSNDPPLPSLSQQETVQPLASVQPEPQRALISRRFRKEARPKVPPCDNAIAQIWKLTKPVNDQDKKKPVKMPLPWNFAINKEKRKSIFRLPQTSIRHMTCRGGLAWYPLGFRHVQKSPTSLELFWPYHCVRPTIGTVWRFKLQNAKTLASIAHLLRILWHSMRWEDIVTKPSADDVIHTIYNDDDIVSIELLKRRNVGKSGLCSEYFVRRIVMPSSDYDEEIPKSEAYTPSSRSGLRARSRQMNLRERTRKDFSTAQPKVQTLWVAEDQVELWQIRQFDSMIRLQQKAAAKKEAESVKVEATKVRLQPGSKPTSEPIKQITVSPALLQQAAALHRSQHPTITATPTKSISLDISQIVGNSSKFATIQPSSAAITIKSSSILTSARSLANAQPSGPITISTTKLLPKKIVVKPTQINGRTLEPEPKSKHPTIKLSGIVGTPKASTILPTAVTKDLVVSPKPSMQQSAARTSSMQVKLSAAQLNELMKVGTDTVVKVSINMPDGSPGVGHLQMIPSGSQIIPTEGQQLMQCKVGSEIKKFLLTAAPASKVATDAPNNYPVDSEVSLETPSLRHRLEQLQQRQQELSKPTQSNNFHKLMTDKDPLWGGRTQTQANEKAPAPEKKKEPYSKKKHGTTTENKEERQRRNVVHHVMKSILDRIERKEELEAKKKKKEEREELQKRKREHMDLARSQQRMQSRLYQVLVKHEEQLKHDIRKRKALIEKYLIHMVQNELHEEQAKRRRHNVEPKSPHKNHNKPSVLAERNNRDSPQKRSKRKQSPAIEAIERSPPSKKPRLSSSSEKLYCVCKTPYDESRFYIGCDLCMTWFHGECVGISERKAKVMDTWVCRDCQQNKPQQELYCLCKTPYDDSQFYIGCDACQDWYHGRCVGISEDQASTIKSYTCPRCKKQARDAAREKTLTVRELAELTRIVKVLQKHKMAWPFLEPVREKDAPGYYKVVTRPMDLQTVMKRLQNRYYTKLSDLVGDVSLIFDNCRQFNGPESNLVRCAEIVETVFVGKIRDMRGR